MNDLIIAKDYKAAIKKLNNGEIDTIEDAKKCLFYIQNYPKDRAKYLESLLVENSLAIVTEAALFTIALFILMMVLLCGGNIFGLSGLFTYLSGVSLIVSRLNAKIKAKKILKEEERQLMLVINDMEGKFDKAKEEKKDVEEVLTDRYIEDIRVLMDEILDVKYPDYLIDVKALFVLANDYLSKKSSLKVTDGVSALDKELLDRYNLLEAKIRREIKVYQNRALNEQAFSGIIEKLTAQGVLDEDTQEDKSNGDDMSRVLKL